MKQFFIFTFIFLVSFFLAEAHEDGLYLSAKVDGYLVDVDYPTTFQEDQPVSLNFFLAREGSSEKVSFTDFDFVIRKGEDVVFYTDLVNKPGIPPTAIFSFPEAGEYTLFLTFNKGDDRLVRAEFPIEVLEKTSEGLSSEVFFGLGGIVIGFFFGGLAFFLKRKKTR